MIRKAISVTVAVFGTAAAVLGAVTVASGAIPAAGGAISGCYVKSTGVLRVIDAATSQTCRTSEAALTWNQQGIQGETGEPGPAGPAGEQGPAGEPGASGAPQVYFDSFCCGSIVSESWEDADVLADKDLPSGSYVFDAQVSVDSADPDAGALCAVSWGGKQIGTTMSWRGQEGRLYDRVAQQIQLKVAASGEAGKAIVSCVSTGEHSNPLAGANLVATRVASVE